MKPIYKLNLFLSDSVLYALDQADIHYQTTEEDPYSSIGSMQFVNFDPKIVISVIPEDELKALNIINKIVEDSNQSQSNEEFSRLEDNEATVANEKLLPYSISSIKLFVLYFSTFGLFSFYWFYKNWKFVESKKLSGFNPYVAAFLQHIFFYRLADFFIGYATRKKYRVFFSPFLLAALYLSSILLINFPHPYSPLLVIFDVFPLLIVNGWIRDCYFGDGTKSKKVIIRNSLINFSLIFFILFMFILFAEHVLVRFRFFDAMF